MYVLEMPYLCITRKTLVFSGGFHAETTEAFQETKTYVDRP